MGLTRLMMCGWLSRRLLILNGLRVQDEAGLVPVLQRLTELLRFICGLATHPEQA